jgi:hypothetical protein
VKIRQEAEGRRQEEKTGALKQDLRLIDGLASFFRDNYLTALGKSSYSPIR